MLSTIVLLFIVGMITLFAAFAGYVIITGENEDARKNKRKNTKS